MSIDRPDEYLHGILNQLRQLPAETEWVEFKHNNADPDDIGEYLSALANSAALLGKVTAWLVWGIDDHSHDILGTDFNPRLAKVHNQELESWLLQQLSPKINFRFHNLLLPAAHKVKLAGLKAGQTIFLRVSVRESPVTSTE